MHKKPIKLQMKNANSNKDMNINVKNIEMAWNQAPMSIKQKPTE